MIEFGDENIDVEHRGVRTTMHPSRLFGPFEGGYKDDNEICRWYEQYLCRCHGDVVKRSVHLTLKRGIDLAGIAGGFSG